EMVARIFLIVFLLSVEGTIAQKRLTNSIGMDFVLIEPGTIVIGEFKPPYAVPDDTVKSLPHDHVMWMGEGRGYNEEEFRLAKELALKDSQEGFLLQIS